MTDDCKRGCACQWAYSATQPQIATQSDLQLMCFEFRYTKQRSKPPPAPKSVSSSHHSQASGTASHRGASARPCTPGRPPTPRTAAHLAAQVSATSRRATPARLPLPQVRESCFCTTAGQPCIVSELLSIVCLVEIKLGYPVHVVQLDRAVEVQRRCFCI